MGTALPIYCSFNPFPGSSELELTVGSLFLPFCQIRPWRLGRLPWNLVLLLPLVLAMGTRSRHPHHASSLTFPGRCLLFTTLHLCLVLLPQVSCCYLMSLASHRRWDCCFWSSPWASSFRQSCSSGLLLAAKESCWFSLLFSCLPPPLFIFPMLVYSKSSLYQASALPCGSTLCWANLRVAQTFHLPKTNHLPSCFHP